MQTQPHQPVPEDVRNAAATLYGDTHRFDGFSSHSEIPGAQPSQQHVDELRRLVAQHALPAQDTRDQLSAVHSENARQIPVTSGASQEDKIDLAA